MSTDPNEPTEWIDLGGGLRARPLGGDLRGGAGGAAHMYMTTSNSSATFAPTGGRGSAETILDAEQRGYLRGLEAAAKVVEQNQERITEADGGTKRSVTPRKHGNLQGLAFAAAIRAIAAASQE